MRKRLYLIVPVLIAASLIASIAFGFPRKEAPEADAYREFERFTNAYRAVHGNYVEDVNSRELVDAAIDAMFDQLDAFSTRMEPENYENLTIRTKGEFGGLGIQIGIRDDYPTVISPIEDTPAARLGIRGGDRIEEIEGENTLGWKILDAVDLLRGPKGTQVTIGIRRPGIDEIIPFDITRDIIKVKSVPYTFLLEGDIAYLRCSNFGEKTAGEIQQAIHELESRAKLKGLILDLRSNPGGLLDAACQVSDLFLDRGQLIVSAMGKSVPRTDYVARTSATFARDYPLLVMINGASASASEIVAGALQDWDRGLVVGLNSFGKGSVQRLFPDMAVSDRTYNQDDTGALKLTTSYYYTPSGRCIQRKKYDSKDFMDSMEIADHDSIPESHFESMPLESLPRFSTLALGREVLGGGGIHPDFKVEERDFSDLALVLSGKASFFHYAMQELPKGEIALSYRADRQEIRKYRSFLRKQDYDLGEYGEEDFENERDFIASRIRFEMLYNQFGRKEAVRAGIGDDWELQEALRLIRKHKTLDGLLEAAELQP